MLPINQRYHNISCLDIASRLHARTNPVMMTSDVCLQALDLRSAELRRELSTATGLLTADIARLVRDGQGLRGDLATVANITKKVSSRRWIYSNWL